MSIVQLALVVLLALLPSAINVGGNNDAGRGINLTTPPVVSGSQGNGASRN